MRSVIATSARWLILALALVGCSQPATRNLGVALIGIDKSRFLACSGPPALESYQGGQDRMSFMTNLKRGQQIGIQSPTLGPASCSVSAVFENSRLVRADFSGDMEMCQFVFDPCLTK
jgi:hypothetical protein